MSVSVWDTNGIQLTSMQLSETRGRFGEYFGVYGVLHYSRMQTGVVAMHKHLETFTEQST